MPEAIRHKSWPSVPQPLAITVFLPIFAASITCLYSPADNNIFSVGFEVPDDQESWVRSKIRPQKYRFDYTIR